MRRTSIPVALLLLLMPTTASAQSAYRLIDTDRNHRALDMISEEGRFFEVVDATTGRLTLCDYGEGARVDASCAEYLAELDLALRAGDLGPNRIGSLGTPSSLAGFSITYSIDKSRSIYIDRVRALSPRRPGYYVTNPGDFLLYLRDVVGVDLDEPVPVTRPGAAANPDVEEPHNVLDWSVRAAATHLRHAHRASSPRFNLDKASWYIEVTRWLDSIGVEHSPGFGDSEWAREIAPMRERWTLQDSLLMEVSRHGEGSDWDGGADIDGLIARGADPNGRGSLGITPIELAALFSLAGMEEPVLHLIRRGANVAQPPSHEEWLMPHEQVFSDMDGVMFDVPMQRLLRILVRQPGVDLNRWSKNPGVLPLWTLSSEPDVFEIWLDAGADPMRPIGVPLEMSGEKLEAMREAGLPIDELVDGSESLSMPDAIRRWGELGRLFLENFSCHTDDLSMFTPCDGVRNQLARLQDVQDILAARGYR